MPQFREPKYIEYMNRNLKKHNLLKLLSEQSNKFDNKTSLEYSVSCDLIYSKLNIDKSNLYYLISELTSSKEIDYFFWNDEDKKGLFATPEGVSSYSKNKYKNIFYSNLKNNLKDFVQIVIPILSLIIAYLAIQLKISEVNNYNQKQIDTLRKEIKILKANNLKSQTQTKASKK
jgi:hypothetical protein